MSSTIDLSNFKRLGRIVQFHRKQAGLSRAQLAEIAGIGKTVIYDIEKGKPTVRLDTLLKLIETLNISLSIDSPLMDRFEAEENEKS
jgi:y4mF family transcriptional regulator